MWWGEHSGNRHGGRMVWFVICIGIGFALISGRSGSWGWWMIFPLCFFVIPFIVRYLTSMSSANEKRKNDADAYEKPKHEARQPEYIMSEDGEPLEVIEEDAPREKQKPDDIEYV